MEPWPCRCSQCARGGYGADAQTSNEWKGGYIVLEYSSNLSPFKLFTELGLHENCFTMYTFYTSFNSTIKLLGAQRSALRCYQDDYKKHSLPRSLKRRRTAYIMVARTELRECLQPRPHAHPTRRVDPCDQTSSHSRSRSVVPPEDQHLPP